MERAGRARSVVSVAPVALEESAVSSRLEPTESPVHPASRALETETTVTPGRPAIWVRLCSDLFGDRSCERHLHKSQNEELRSTDQQPQVSEG